MAKKWADFTRREKIIGVIAAIGGVFLLGGLANGISGPQSIDSTAPAQDKQGSLKKEPVLTYKNIQETETIPFEKITQNDPTMDKGSVSVTTPGANGEKVKTYKVTLTDNIETARELVKEEVTVQPVNEVTSIGTHVAPVQQSNCDPNYADGCVPIASDVDCGGGSGNGPAYFYGTARVVGRDIYGLDRDGDGIACE